MCHIAKITYENIVTLSTSLMVKLGKNPFTSSTRWSCSMLVWNCCNVWRFEPSPYSNTLYCCLKGQAFVSLELSGL